MAKHFNAGNVWGKIQELEKKYGQNETPYLLVTLDCTGKYGGVRAYGRLFGQEKIDRLIAWHKANPGQIVRFRGYMGQYEKQDEVLTNFTFYAWAPAEDQAPRAAFVLVGKVTDLAEIGDRWRVTLHLSRKGQAGYSDTEEDFDLWAFDGKLLANVMCDQIVELKGCMQQGQGEDEYGASTGSVRPIIHRCRIIEGF